MGTCKVDSRLWAVLGASALLGGCCPAKYTVHGGAVLEPAYVEVDSECPAPQQEAAVEASVQGVVWVPGYWDWRGRWVWVAGHFQRVRSGYVWQPPVCVFVAGKYRYHPGYWRPVGIAPPPVYTQPGVIQVAVAQPAPRPGVQVQVQPPAPRAGVDVQVGRPSGGSVTVQQPQGPSVQVRPPEAPQPPPAPAPPPAGPTVVVGGGVSARPGTVTVNPAPAPAPSPGTVVVGGGVAARPGTVSPAPAPGPGGGIVVGGGVGVRPGTVSDALSCRAQEHRAPPGGMVIVHGTGLNGATFSVGGNFAVVEGTNPQGTNARVRIPSDSHGGALTASRGGQSVSCGTVVIVGRPAGR
ncbi:MAG: hypothetical protein NZ898_14720 [Myxococcota bacterium]|nr:hypothetical protein [Myxococcota bacterium]